MAAWHPGSPSSARSTSTSSFACERAAAARRDGGGRDVRARSRAARARTRPSPAPGSAPRSRSSRRSGATPFADEALAGLREAGVDARPARDRRAHRRRADQVDGGGETTIAVAPGANAALGAVRAAADTTRCSASWRSPTRPCSRRGSGCTGLFCLNAAPARPVAVDPDLDGRQPLRARGARPRATASWR